MERTATCSCGQLSVTIEGEPAHHGLCSCLECQKATGGPFGYSGYWSRSAVKTITGSYTSWRRSSDAGRWIENCFCPTCGSILFSYAEFDPTVINIPIGNFADPAFPAPAYAVWNMHRHPWVVLDPAWASYDRQPSLAPGTGESG